MTGFALVPSIHPVIPAFFQLFKIITRPSSPVRKLYISTIQFAWMGFSRVRLKSTSICSVGVPSSIFCFTSSIPGDKFLNSQGCERGGAATPIIQKWCSITDELCNNINTSEGSFEIAHATVLFYGYEGVF